MNMSNNDKFIVDDVYICPQCKGKIQYSEKLEANIGIQQRFLKCSHCTKLFSITINTNKGESFNNF